MREILFRGKHKAGGVWCYGNLAVSKGGVAIITPDDTPCGVYGQVDPATVGQYVGLADKTGDWIYEGDIIRAVLPATEVCRGLVWPLMAVAFHEGAFGVWQSQREFTPLRSFASRVEFEIAGNIHDNPDMPEVCNG